MNTNLFDDLLNNLEIQIKQAERDLIKEKESVLLGIECKMEEATENKEILSLVKQSDEAEKKFEQEKVKQKNRIIKEYLTVMNRLTKKIQKVYSIELNNK